MAASALKRLHDDVKRRGGALPPPPTPGPAFLPSPGGEKKRVVVVVEDDAAIRALIARALSSSFDVAEASTGLGALELLGRMPAPNLILLDVMLPEVDGVTIARKLKAHPALKHVPIVFVTAKDAPHDVAQGIGAGATQYLTKPFSIKTLQEVVDRLAK